MKAPLSPCAPTSHLLQSDFLQSLPKKRRTDVLEPSSGTGTTGKGVENPETRSIDFDFPSASDIEGTVFNAPYYYDTPGFRDDRDKSSGITWVAVHGIDSICVLTSVNGVDMTRAEDHWKCITENEILSLFLKTVISDIEDLADPSSKSRKRLVHLSIEKPPFGVVSVIPLTNEADEKSDQDEVDEESDQDEVDEDFVLEDSENCSPNKAVEFLEKKMKSIDSTSTTSKTIKTAIGALQQLFHKQLEAFEIQGCFLKFEEMKVEFLQISELERHLEVVNAEASIN